MNRRKLLVGLAALLVLGITASGVHRVEEWTFHYWDLPPTDEKLHQWLTAQPGVERAEVWRDGDKLRIRYRVRFWREGPVKLLQAQDVESQLEQLGYKHRDETLMDRERMGWGW